MLNILCLGMLSLFPAESKGQISLNREAKTAVVVATVTLENAATVGQAKTIGRCLPPEKVEREILSEGLNHEDIADLFIDDIRRWKKWEYSNTILSLYKPEANNMTKRSIIRFALHATDPRSKTLLDQARKDNPERVKDCEEILQLEKELAKEIPRK